MIEHETNDGIVTLRLAHGKASALDVELCEAITRSLNDAADARAVILTGTGTIFSAAVDLFRMTNEGAPYIEPDESACVMCTPLACMHNCPSGALLPIVADFIDMGVAVWHESTCLRSAMRCVKEKVTRAGQAGEHIYSGEQGMSCNSFIYRDLDLTTSCLYVSI